MGEEVASRGKEHGCGEAFIWGLLDIPKEVHHVVDSSSAYSEQWQLPFKFIFPILGEVSFELNQRAGIFGPPVNLTPDEVKLWLISGTNYWVLFISMPWLCPGGGSLYVIHWKWWPKFQILLLFSMGWCRDVCITISKYIELKVGGGLSI